MPGTPLKPVDSIVRRTRLLTEGNAADGASTLVRMEKDDATTLVVLHSAAALGEAVDIAVDDTFVYWADAAGNVIKRAPLPAD